jgi:glycosyltransferase involved in cell wall biosynthesis
VTLLAPGYAVTESTAGNTAVPTPRVSMEGRRLVIASVPANHVYVRHIARQDGTGPVRLADPDPDGREVAATQRWWPPVMLDPAWVAEHDFDVFHLHFGFDARSVEDLEALVAELRRRGKPLVFTVHDLRNPHHADREAHDRQLDVLVPAAAQLITLTSGAAEEIQRRWGREATVLPHPHVVPLDTMRALRAARSRREPGAPLRVGVHLKSLRAGMHPHPLLPTLVETVRELPGAVLQVNAHCDILDDGGARLDADLARTLRGYADEGLVDLRVHDYFTDDELWHYLASLDVSVLPYRFGTHSGWLEACRDLGTGVIAPTCGYFADQAQVLTYVHDESGYDPGSLASAVRAAYDGHPAPTAGLELRRRERAAVAAAHDRIYAAALDGAVPGAGA